MCEKVKFSELDEMHGFGDANFTLGLFFTSASFAILAAPLVCNYFIPPK